MKYSDRRPYLETAHFGGFWQRAQFDLRLKCFELAMTDESKCASVERRCEEAVEYERLFMETEWEGSE